MALGESWTDLVRYFALSRRILSLVKATVEKLEPGHALFLKEAQENPRRKEINLVETCTG